MPDADAWGIEPGYHDISGAWHEPSSETVLAVLAALGAESELPPIGGGDPTWIVQSGQLVRLDGRWQLTLESGERSEAEGALLPDLPLGYHRLMSLDNGREIQLFVTPPRCAWDGDVRSWGWAVQLYAMRSRTSWGIGDLGDLRAVGSWAAERGAAFTLINPLHAPLVGTPQQASPYFPSSRCFRNPLYIRIEEVPDAVALGDELEGFVKAGRALNDQRLIDRDAVWRLKLQALQHMWDRRQPDAGFDAYVAREGDNLRNYATFCALGERHGWPWTDWPENIRRPNADGSTRFAREHANRVQFFSWLQYLVDAQVDAASAALPLIQDLAIGIDPAGADAWLWQDSFAFGASVGAPADEFNQRGQDWGFPPLDPWRLRQSGFAPYVAALRAAFHSAAGVRIDHVMGLFRLWWIPAGRSAAEGAYVRYPWQEMLDILALESHRANAVVVGEDLGTVQDWVRRELAAHNVLSNKIVWFEPEPPDRYPTQALAAVTTHDLPTLAGLWTGTDLTAQRQIGSDPNEASTKEIRERVGAWIGADDDAAVDEVSLRTHALLATAKSSLITATLDDALGVEERPNMPGTTTEWPNWCLALPKPLEDIVEDPTVNAIAEALHRHDVT